MTHDQYDKAFWERHWHDASPTPLPAHPALETETAALEPGTALDAGSGRGAEANWLAERGWTVTAIDISAQATQNAASTQRQGAAITWLTADLTTWEPESQFDLVATFYAHAEIPQLALYQRVSRWVAPGGTLLIVGHHHGHQHPGHATADLKAIQDLLDPAGWLIRTADDRRRPVQRPTGTLTSLHDVVVSATNTAAT